MRRLALCVVLLASCAIPCAFAQEMTADQILAKLDEKAKAFSSVQTSFTQRGVAKGVPTPEDFGTIVMAMSNGVPRILFDKTSTPPTRVLIDKGKGTAYFVDDNTFSARNVDPRSDQVMLSLLGFGTRAETIKKGYSAKAKGKEVIGGVQAVVLELDSIAEFTKAYQVVTLWLDPQTWTPVQTRLAETSRSYYQFNYSKVQLNRPIPNGTFDLKMKPGAKKQ